MARTDTLNNFLTDVADSIRTKKGTTDSIPASNFDTEIESIEAGGGEPNLQSKSITITENGTQNVTADEGYDGLSDVSVTTNVQSSDVPEVFSKTGANLSNNNYGNTSLIFWIKELPRAIIKQISDVIRYTYPIYLFSGMRYYNGILDLRDFDTNHTTCDSFRYMFSYLSYDVTKNNNTQIIFPENFGPYNGNLSYTFDHIRLNSLDLTNMATNNVSNMQYMFNNSTIQNLNLSNFKILRNVDMESMFQYFTTNVLDISSFDSSKIISIYNMFRYAYINQIILPENFGSNCKNMAYLFGNTSISNGVLDLTKLNTSNATSFQYMFSLINYNCENGITLNLSSFDTAKVTNMSYMFVGNSSTTNSMKIDNIIFPENFGINCNNMSYMFQYFNYGYQNGLKHLDLSNFNTDKLVYASNMFYNSRFLASIDLSSFNFTKVTYFSSMFASCGTSCLASDGAYADGIPYIYVKDETAQNWILTKSNGKPKTWSTANVIIKEV